MSHAALSGSLPILTVRRLFVDFSTPIRRHWNGDDAFLTAFFNALSFSFPEGEQFFIESVRNAAQNLEETTDNKLLLDNARGFIGQEASHRRMHAQYNAQLEAHGLVNHWEARIVKRKTRVRRLFANAPHQYLYELAITAGYEHLTAVLGDLTLQSQNTSEDWLALADVPLQTLWRWHAAEECEHKSVAFDLYQALNGSYRGRLFWFVYVSMQFTTDVIRQTINNLWHDRTLHKPSTWWSAFKFCLGRYGWVWRCLPRFIAYMSKDFHPNQMDNKLTSEWLEANSRHWEAVGTPSKREVSGCDHLTQPNG